MRSGRESNGQDNDSAFGVLPPVQTAQPTCPSPGSGPNSHANRVKGHFRHSCHTYYCYPCKSSLLMRVWHLCRMYSSPWYWVSHYAAPAQCACARCARTPIGKAWCTLLGHGAGGTATTQGGLVPVTMPAPGGKCRGNALGPSGPKTGGTCHPHWHVPHGCARRANFEIL